LALPLAAAGQVGEGFFHERTEGNLPCQASSSHFFCGEWALENAHRYVTPTLQQLELVIVPVLVGFAIAFGLALLARRFRWLRPPLLAGTGILFCCCCRSAAAAARPRSSPSPPTRCRSSTAT
jgi:hypothetical protein